MGRRMEKGSTRLYGHLVKRFSEAPALCPDDLEMYDRIVKKMFRDEKLSTEEDASLQALTRQGRHYLKTQEVRYKVNGWFLGESELVEKVRVLIGQQLGIPESQATKLIRILQIAERHDPLCRVDTQALEAIFEQAGKNRGPSAYEQFRKPYSF